MPITFKKVIIIPLCTGLILFTFSHSDIALAQIHQNNKPLTGVFSNTSADPSQVAQNLNHLWQQAQDRYIYARDTSDPILVWNGVKNVVNIYKYKAERCHELWGSTYKEPFKFTLSELGAGRGEIYISTEDSATLTGENSAFQELVGKGAKVMTFLAVYRFDDNRPPLAASVGLRFNRLPFGDYSKPEFVAYGYKFTGGSQKNKNENFEPVENLLSYNANSERLRWGYAYQRPENRLLLKQIIQHLPEISSLLYRSVTKYELGFMDHRKCIK